MRTQTTLSQVLTAALESLVGAIYVAEPGSIIAYDPVTQTATVQPVLQDVRFDTDTGQPYGESWPVLNNVRVMWPTFGGAILAGNMKPGDSVTLEAWDFDPTGVVTKPGAPPVIPVDIRKLAGHAWRAVPQGLTVPFPAAEAAAAAKGALLGLIGDAQLRFAPGVIQLGLQPGIDGGLTKPVALGPPVVAAWTALATYAASLTTAAEAIVATPPATLPQIAAALLALATAMQSAGSPVATALATAETATPATVLQGQ